MAIVRSHRKPKSEQPADLKIATDIASIDIVCQLARVKEVNLVSILVQPLLSASRLANTENTDKDTDEVAKLYLHQDN